jgi:uncharacterized protein (DUF58 family)
MANDALAARRWAELFKSWANRDFFPEFSARVRRWAYHPLAILVLAAGVAILCGIFLHPRMFALAAGLLGVIVVGVCWPALTMRGISASWSFDRERSVEGESVGVTLTAVNHLPWPAVGLVVHDSGQEPAFRLGVLPARQEVAARWSFIPRRRGEYPLGLPEILTGFPFGLWQARKSALVERRLIVWPRTYPVGPPPSSEGDAMIEGNVARRKVGSTGEVLGVRPYRRGDSPRRIHWPQSARHDRLIVCEFESTSRPVVQLILDADRSIHARGPEGEGSLEWAIRVAASLARGWLEEGVQVGLAAPGVSIAAASGAGQIRRILDALARLPDDSETGLNELLALPICRGISGLQIVITTDRRRRTRREGQQRWVVLSARNFGETVAPSSGCEEGPPRSPCWLSLDSPQRIPQALRFGWTEARHGS